jgi:hypothetical protein
VYIYIYIERERERERERQREREQEIVAVILMLFIPYTDSDYFEIIHHQMHSVVIAQLYYIAISNIHTSFDPCEIINSESFDVRAH